MVRLNYLYEDVAFLVPQSSIRDRWRNMPKISCDGDMVDRAPLMLHGKGGTQPTHVGCIDHLPSVLPEYKASASISRAEDDLPSREDAKCLAVLQAQPQRYRAVPVWHGRSMLAKKFSAGAHDQLIAMASLPKCLPSA